MKKLVSLIFPTALAVLSLPAKATDEDGCWSGRHANGPCLEYTSYQKDNKTYIELTNVCSKRLYMRWCAGDKCGADSLGGGKSKRKYEYIIGANVSAKATGSTIWTKDWVCSSKVADWHD